MQGRAPPQQLVLVDPRGHSIMNGSLCATWPLQAVLGSLARRLLMACPLSALLRMTFATHFHAARSTCCSAMCASYSFTSAQPAGQLRLPQAPLLPEAPQHLPRHPGARLQRALHVAAAVRGGFGAAKVQVTPNGRLQRVAARCGQARRHKSSEAVQGDAGRRGTDSVAKGRGRVAARPGGMSAVQLCRAMQGKEECKGEGRMLCCTCAGVEEGILGSPATTAALGPPSCPPLRPTLLCAASLRLCCQAHHPFAPLVPTPVILTHQP